MHTRALKHIHIYVFEIKPFLSNLYRALYCIWLLGVFIAHSVQVPLFNCGLRTRIGCSSSYIIFHTTQTHKNWLLYRVTSYHPILIYCVCNSTHQLNFYINIFHSILQSTSQIITRGATQRAKIQTRAAVNKNIQNNKCAEPPPKTKLNGTATMNNEQENGIKKPTITLNEAKRKARNSATKSTNEILVKDIYQNVSKMRSFIKVCAYLANGDFYWYQW